jgi:predicted phage terminase large subunit-like protein
MKNEKLQKIFELDYELCCRELQRRRMRDFIDRMDDDYEFTPFHEAYIAIIQAWVTGKIRKLMVSIPPQTGKSHVSTRRLPAFIMGRNPETKLAICSYSSSMARRFGREIKRTMSDPNYRILFPNTRLPENKDYNSTNSADIVDIPAGDKTGNLFFVGRGGGLTGEPVDILIMDDLYKNASEANSPIIRRGVIDWYNTVAESRLHNFSRQLMVFTRWNEEDLIGYIRKTSDVIDITSLQQFDDCDPSKWYHINFEALKVTEKTDIDKREKGDALYPQRHSREKLEETRRRLLKDGDADTWETLYQGNPIPKTGLLYSSGFNLWIDQPELYSRKCYIDVADTGKDRLCAICYGVTNTNMIAITDVYHTSEPQEVTEIEVADLLIRNNTQDCDIESNAGGRSFARNVIRILREKNHGEISINDHWQKQNKESRIITSAPNCMRTILMPPDWIERFPLFSNELLRFKKLFSANSFDDAADSLTGVYEKSGIDPSSDFGVGMA